MVLTVDVTAMNKSDRKKNPSDIIIWIVFVPPLYGNGLLLNDVDNYMSFCQNISVIRYALKWDIEVAILTIIFLEGRLTHNMRKKKRKKKQAHYIFFFGSNNTELDSHFSWFVKKNE